MIISGETRVDMSGFVDKGCLYFGDAEVRHLWGNANAVVSPTVCEVWIGDANNVVWSVRVVEILGSAAQVRITGSNSRGVAMAVEGLTSMFGETSAA